MDKFFTQENCDRCGESLKNGRIMSMFNKECICMDCKKKNVLIRNTKRHLMPTMQKSVKAIIILKV